MRDYFDWLSPYVITDSFVWRDYLYFWLRDVDLSKMPLNTITGLAEFYQPQYKVTHGNFLDCIHANYLMNSDILVTADRIFYKVLTHVCENHKVNASPMLIAWGQGSAVVQLANAIEQTARRRGYGKGKAE
jgi:FlaA1/EpsC-like NDP-sugar epimerase